MRTWSSQRGATLIFVIGVIAALAILAAALVALSVNVMGNTSATEKEVKAFNVAEAGLDTGQKQLWQDWPSGATAPTFDVAAFRSQFAVSGFPAPESGSFIEVAFFDDDGTPLPTPGIDRNVHTDANGNDIMWIESRGATGSGSAKIIAAVQRVQYDLNIPENVALYTTGDAEINGTGNQPVIGLDPPATEASAIAGGAINVNGETVFESGIAASAGSNITLQDIFPTELMLNIIQSGKVYADWAAYEAWKTANPGVEPFATDPRIVIIENGDVDAKDLPDTDVVNGLDTTWTEEDPGILVVLNGDFKNTGLKKIIYGIVYVANGMVLAGNAEVHGMVVAEDYATVSGTRAINYNGKVIANLNRPVTLAVRLVPNTWREIQP